ncbi:type II secretion system protein GspG, partial [bacterium]|nr:type II secretion system protein GspG [bacterium]
AILAAIIIATTTSARLQARDSRRAADLDEVRTALEMYFNKEGTYPDHTGCNADTFEDMCNDLISAGYLATTPKDPKNTGDYVYCYSGNSDGYVLKAEFETNASKALDSDYDKNYLDCTCNGDDKGASGPYDYCIINP